MTSPEILKIVLLGESKVGKTCIMNQYFQGKFDPDIPPSTTPSMSRKEINFLDNTKITADTWDTPGLTKYRSLAKIFFKDAKAVILVYDPTDENSFKELKEFWYDQVKALNLILAVVANKCDLEEKKVKDEEGKEFADSIGAIFASVTAKDNIGISQLFEKIAEAIKNKKII